MSTMSGTTLKDKDSGVSLPVLNMIKAVDKVYWHVDQTVAGQLIRNSFNVSTIIDNGVGSSYGYFTVQFKTRQDAIPVCSSRASGWYSTAQPIPVTTGTAVDLQVNSWGSTGGAAAVGYMDGFAQYVRIAGELV